MTHHLCRTLTPSFVALAALLCSNVAHAADDAGASETAAARALAVDGVKLALADDCEGALDKLDRAQKLKPSPIVLRHLGECQVKLGRWVEGSESLRKLLREPLPEDASPALEQAYESAQTTLRDVKPRIPNMKIVVNAPRETDLVVKVDGKEVADSVVGVALPTDPGDHVIVVSAPGFVDATSSVKLGPGATQTVTLDLKRDPLWTPPKAPPASTAAAARGSEPTEKPRGATSAPVEESSGASKTIAYVSYGVAVAGLGVGIAFGQSAMKDEREFRESCPNQVCAPEDKDSLEFAKTKGTIATIGFATAGAGLALGTVLLLTSSDSSSAKSGRAAAPRTAAFRPRAKIGLGNVTLATDF
ncbi:MAG TPA: PEGA domain-containing protein [Polyangiaceae bacterium]